MERKFINYLLILIFCLVFSLSFLSAADVLDELHLNIQTTDSSTGEIVTGTFNFVFNITTNSDCSGVVYSNSTSLTTDSRGIISYYLQDVNLDFTSQYYLCHYRNGVLINSSKIARSPYSFTAKNVTTSGLIVDSNLNMGSYNVTATYFIGSGKYLTDINSSAINFSAVNYWQKSGSTLYYNDGNVGIGITSPNEKLQINGSLGVGTGANSYIKFQSASNWYYYLNSTGDDFYLNDVENDNFITNKYSGGGTGKYIGLMNNGLVVKNSGNVGVGLTDPQRKLEIYGDTAYYGIRESSSDVGAKGGVFWSNEQVGGSAGSITLYREQVNNAPHAMLFTLRNVSSSMNEVMRIDSSGKVGIGTTAPGVALDVVGSISASSNVLASNSVQATGYVSTPTLTPFVSGGNINFTNYARDTAIMTVNTTSGRVGIGTTSPSDLLHINGVNPFIRLVNTGTGGSGLYIYDANGDTYIGHSSGADAIITGSVAGDTAIRSNGKNILFSTDSGSTSQLYLKNGGNVGIGTTSPTSKLNVIGDINATANVSTPMLCLNGDCQNSWDSAVSGEGGWNDTGTQVQLVTSSDNVSANTLFVDNSAGRVGIGTSSPGVKLDVAGIISSSSDILASNSLQATAYTRTPILAPYTSGGNVDIKNYATDTSYLSVNTTSGRVGIGIENPTYKLDIRENRNDGTGAIYNTNAGTDAFAGFYLVNDEVSASPFVGYTSRGFTGAGGADNLVVHGSSKNVSFVAGSTERMRILASGNVGINTTTPSQLLHVRGPGAQIKLESPASGGAVTLNLNPEGADGAFFQAGTTMATLGANSIPLQIRSSAATTPIYFSTYDGGWLDRMTISKNGNVGIGTTGPLTKLHVNGSAIINGTLNMDSNKITSLGNGTSATDAVTLAQLQSVNGTANTGNVGGSGTLQYIPMWNGTTSLNNSNIYQLGGNIGIGTTGPGDKLEIGDGTASNFVTFNIPASDGAYGGLKFEEAGAGAMAAGYYRVSGTGADRQFRITDGTDLSANARFVVTQSGNVGINTTTPQNKLNVIGDGNFTGDLHIGGTDIYGDTTSQSLKLSSGAGSILSYGTNTLGIGDNTMTFTVLGTPAIKILDTGYVGINTTSPGNLLEVKGSNSGAQIRYNRGGAYTWDVGMDAGSNFDFNSDVSTVMTIFYGGNVGINNTNPQGTLDVNGTICIGGNCINSWSGLSSQVNSTSWNSTGPYVFLANTSAYVGIGTTAPANTLDIRGTGDYVFAAQGASAKGFVIAENAAYVDIIGLGAAHGSYNDIDFRTSATAGQLYLKTGGNVGIGTTSPTSKLTINNNGTFVYTQGLTFGDGDTGFYENADDTLVFRSGTGGDRIIFADDTLYANGGARWGLHGIAPSATVPDISPVYSDGNTGIGSAGADILSLIAGGVNGLNVYTTGGVANVGIGTTSPSYKLEVNGSMAFTSPSNSISLPRDDGTQRNVIRQDSNNFYFGDVWETTNYQGDIIVFRGWNGTAQAEKMRIAENGNVGIGTTTPGDKLDVYGSSTNNFAMATGYQIGVNEWTGIRFGYMPTSGGGADTYGKSAIVFERTGPTYADGKIHILNDGSTTDDNANLADSRITIDSTGKVGINTTSPSATLQVKGDVIIEI